ncbi:MAG: DNA methylase N-4 [Xanthobacteraceae bacterium]|nr:MAG: DNA methylase N-4 [Xanthobacteraceae bacterium]
MIKRLTGGSFLVQSREKIGHNSGKSFSELEQFLRTATIEWRSIDQVRTNSRPTRIHKQKKIATLRRSIASFKVFAPLVVDPDGRLLAGHARFICARELGFNEVPVIVVSHLTEFEKRAFAIADNRIAELASWDLPQLKLELEELTLPNNDFDATLTGFDSADIDRILAFETVDKDDALPPLGHQAVSQLGDLWFLDKHRVFCGNALETESYDALLTGELVQMVITDPPYNCRIAGHARSSRSSHREFVAASGDLTERQFAEFLGRFLGRIKQVTPDGAIIYVFMDHAHSLELQIAAYPIFGKQKNVCVWVKENAGMGSFYRSQHELVYVFKNGSGSHINNFNLGERGRYRTNVWNYPGANTGPNRREALDIHPTVKPCSMFMDAIQDCSHRNGLILDCFGGSGTTLIACERTQRIGRIIELDPLYVDLTIRRWQVLTGGKAVHVATGRLFDELKPLQEEMR